MRIFRSFANPVQQPSFDQVDAGSGGGAAGSGGQQGGAPAAGNPFGAQGGQQGVGSGAAAPVSLADDTPITIDGKQTTWKEYRTGNFVPKADYDNVRQTTRAEVERNLRALAAKLNLKPQGQQQRQPQERVDPFAKVRGLPIVDGDTVAALAENGFGQVGQLLTQQQNAIKQLSDRLNKIQGGVGTLAKERSGQERLQRVTQAITSLGEGYDAKDPLLNDVAQDLIDAWEFQNEGEFHKMFQDRIAAFEKFIRARDQAKLAQAKKVRFTRPGGSASPSGQARLDPKKSVSQIADQLFGSRAS